jgi:signal transduction histidine kinase
MPLCPTAPSPEDLARATAENPHPVLALTPAGVVLWANKASSPLLSVLGCATGQALPGHWRELCATAYASDSWNTAEVVSEGRAFSLTFVPSAETGHLDVYAVDTTDRRRLTDTLRESEHRFRNLFEASPVGLLVLDEDGSLLDANHASLAVLEVADIDQARQMRLLDLLALTEDAREMLRGGQTLRFVATFPRNGSRGADADAISSSKSRHVQVVVSPLHSPAGPGRGGVLVHLRDVTGHHEAQRMLRQQAHALGERVKELHCLFGISKIIERVDFSFEQVMQGIVDLVPPAFQHSEVACARIAIEGREFRSSNFASTSWRLLRDLRAHGQKVGAVEVCYFEERPAEEEGPFMREERNLLDSIAERLGRMLERKRSEEGVRQLSQQLLQAQEVERQRVAVDLHDNLAQDLSILKMGLDTLLIDRPDTSPETREKVTKLAAMLQHSIVAVRDMSYSLHPASLEQLGLVNAVRQYCEDFAARRSMAVDFFSVGVEQLTLGPDTQIALFRLVQEGLTNIAKHAHAEHATIRLSASFPYLMLRIEDDGTGFDPARRLSVALHEKRMGLRSMEQRVAFLNGEMSLSSEPSRGTKILIRIPCGEATHGAEAEDNRR